MAITLKEGQQLIENARLGYPKLYVAESFRKNPLNKPRFGCQIYMPKSDVKGKAKLDAEIKRLVDTHLQGKMPSEADLPITDGDGPKGDEHTKGCWIISANRNEKDKNGRHNPPSVGEKFNGAWRDLKPEDGRPYGGCWCNFLVSHYYNNAWNRICTSLEIVQFVKDDEPFGAGAVNPDIMPDLSDEDDDEDI